MCKETSGPSSTPNEAPKPKPHFVPGTEKLGFTQSRFYYRFRRILRLPFSNGITTLITCVITLTVVNHTLAYLWKGPGHPLNRYRWYQMKARGELSPEMLEKERLLSQYVRDSIYREPLPRVRTIFD